MSSLKCDRWSRPNLERAVWLQSAPPVEYWFHKPCGWPLGGRPAACAPTGALWALRRERACSGGRAGLLGAVGRLGGRETDLVFEVGRNIKYNTKLFLPYLHITHTYRHTHPPGLRNGPTYVALALWLNGPPCNWSGVEWEPRHFRSLSNQKFCLQNE